MQFKYLNLNPKGYREEDCVVRAISLALNLEYFDTRRKLKLIANLLNCDELCVCCYKHLLDNVYKLQRMEGYKGATIEKFLTENPTGKYLIRVKGHLTCGIDGVLRDTWDCRNRKIDIVWVI